MQIEKMDLEEIRRFREDSKARKEADGCSRRVGARRLVEAIDVKTTASTEAPVNRWSCAPNPAEVCHRLVEGSPCSLESKA